MMIYLPPRGYKNTSIQSRGGGGGRNILRKIILELNFHGINNFPKDML